MQKRSPSEITVLVVSSSCETKSSLQTTLSTAVRGIHAVSSCTEATSLLQAFDIPVVIFDATISDGTWRDLLEITAASVIVTSPFADEILWAEVLNRGGYDVLPQPFDPSETIRITEAAARYRNVMAHLGTDGRATSAMA